MADGIVLDCNPGHSGRRRAPESPRVGRVAARAGRAFAAGRALSLDVAAGAVAGGLLASHVTGAGLPWTWWPVLAASVWAAYTADHLADARRSGDRCRATRHRLHHDRAGALSVALITVVLAAMALALTSLPAVVLAVGAVLVGAVGVHLVFAQREQGPLVPKEIAAAAIYAAGLWSIPLAVADRPTAAVGWLVTLHALAAFQNLGVNAWFELEQDRADRVRSLARSLGRPALRRVLTAGAIVGAGVGLIGAVTATSSTVAAAFAILAVLQVVPVVVLRGARVTASHERYRVIGDLAFFAAPVVLLWPPP